MVTKKQVAGIVAVCAVVAGGLLYADSKYSSLEGTYPGAPGDSWCDTDFAKRIDVNVDNTAGSALTYYQVYVNLTTNPINETSMRVYNTTDCTLRSHWTENETGGNSYGVWINYSAVAASAWVNNTAIYYDNNAVSSTSNKDTTFLFSDDFPGSTLNATKWNIKDGSCSVSNGYAQPYGLPVFVLTNTFSVSDHIIHVETVQTQTANTGIVFRSTDAVRDSATFYISYLRNDDYLHFYKLALGGGTSFGSKAFTQGAATYEQHVSFTGNDLDVDIWKDNVYDTLGVTADGTTNEGRIGFVDFTNVAEGAWKIDYIFVRGYAATEPSTELGSEEDSVAYNVSGYVKTALGVAIENAYVSNNRTSATNYTNASGYYILSLSNTTYNISAAKSLHTTNHTTVTVSGVDSTNNNITLTAIPQYTPSAPTNLQNTKGTHWINHTWANGGGANITDSYSVKVNDVWHNATDNTYWNATYGPLLWQNISVYAYNNSGATSTTGVSDNAQCPNIAWSYGKNITLLGAVTELTNYPYVITLAKESNMAYNYGDLCFYDEPVDQGGNNIEYEIETYDSATATIWLNITTLPIAGKTIAVYYGGTGVIPDAEAVWDSDYVGVWHLSDALNAFSGITTNETTIGDFSCWGVTSVVQDPNSLQDYINTWQRKTGTGISYFRYSTYNTTTESYSAVAEVFNNSNAVHQGHMDMRYFGDKYHICYSQTNGSEDFAVDVNATTWQGIHDHVLISDETRITPDLGWRAQPGYLVFNNSYAWMVGSNYNDGGNSYVCYVTWSETEGWNTTLNKITNTADAGYINCESYVIKDEKIYMYYHCRSGVSKVVTSDDEGATWNTPTSLGLSNLDGYTAPIVHVRNNKFVLIYNTDEDSADNIIMMRSDDGITFSDPTVLISGTSFIFNYAWINDTHLILTYPDASSYVLANDLGDVNSDIINVSDYLTYTSSVGTVNDSTSNNNDGIPFGGNSIGGIVGDAVLFSDDAIAINTNDFYNVGTISWWQNATTTSTGMVFTGGQNTSGTANIFQLGADGSKKEYGYWQAVGDTLRSDANIVQSNESQHVVWTSNGTYTKCFVNGTEVQLTATTGAIQGTWASDVIDIAMYGIGATMKGTDALSGPFTGIIDQVELSKTVRSDDWTNLSYQMVVNDSYVTFGAEQSSVTGTTPAISNIQNGSVSPTSQYVNATINQSANNVVIYDTGATGATSTACAGQWSAAHACLNASDGNWSSYAESAGAMNAYAYFNHTVPAGTSQPESLWHVKDNAGHANVTIPTACWGATLYLRAMGSDIGNSMTWQCDNGPGWTTLRSSVANHAYEEEMSFKYKSTWDNATAAPNITLTSLTPSTGYNFYVRACNVTNSTLCSNSSVYTFTTAAGTSTNPVYACANEYVLVNNWSAAPETFVQIDANMTNDTVYSYYNGSTYIDYWSGYFFNNDTIVAKNDSCFIYFTADTTIDCVPHSGGVTMRNDVWHYTFLPGSVAKTLSEINASMVADGGDVWSLLRWVNSTESYNATGTVQPNEGVVVYANNTFVWTV